jgi:hypothetical protein
MRERVAIISKREIIMLKKKGDNTQKSRIIHKKCGDNVWTSDNNIQGYS